MALTNKKKYLFIKDAYLHVRNTSINNVLNKYRYIVLELLTKKKHKQITLNTVAVGLIEKTPKTQILVFPFNCIGDSKTRFPIL